MKKILFTIIVGLFFTTLFSGCEDVNDQFKGLDDLTKTTNVATYTYKLVDADYTTISNAALKVATNYADSVKAKSIKTNKAFSDNLLASDYIPYLLASTSTNFKYGDVGSMATITYNYGQTQPTYLADLTTINIVTDAEYQTVWGDHIGYVSAFTPAKTPSTKIPGILAARFPTATSGTFKFVEYNYSATEATSAVVDFKYFNEDFTSHTFATSSPYTTISENGWLNKDTTSALTWVGKVYSGNNYAQVTSKGSLVKNNVFLITKKIDLTYAIAPQFSFDVNVGYWNADCLTVLISTDFDGTTANIGKATWVDLSSNFTFPQTPTSGYGTLASAGTADLTAYIGKPVYIAFKYSGDGRSATDRGADPLRTTTYQIDNVKVSEMRTALSVPSTEKQYVVYKYNGTTWITPLTADGIFVSLQPADYTAMGLSYIASTNVPLYIPQFLKQKYPYALEGDAKTVVYKSSSTVTYSGAKQYTLTNGEWVLNDFAIDQTAMFKRKAAGWVYYNADILVGLNPDTKNSSSNLGNFTIVSVDGAQGWAWDATYGMKISGYLVTNLANEDWLISPAMSFTERLKPTLTFDHTGKYFGTMANEATLWISTNYSEGLPSTATWTQITIPTYMTNSDYTYVTPAVDLSAYAGINGVRIAFKYISSTTAAGTWEVKNVHVFEKEE